MRQFPPSRIVCLTEETVETLYLLGEQHRIVGVSGYAVRPPQVRREKPRVSAFTTANIAKILALDPDLVLTFSDLQAPIVAELVQAGVAGAALTIVPPNGYIAGATSRKWTVSRRFAAPHSFSSPLLAPEGRLAVRQRVRNRIMPIGTVKFFNTDKGYGFIQPDDGGNDAFVHISAVEKAGMRSLNKDQRVSYELEEGQRGRTSAINLQPAE